MDYFRNHQLYLAEKCDWLDRHVIKTSKRAIIKIESFKESSGKQRSLLFKLVVDSLFKQMKNKDILRKEGFYSSNIDN